MIMDDEKKKAAVDFGQKRGWKLSSAPFSLKTLSRRGVYDLYGYPQFEASVIDHPQFYRVGKKAAAIVSHTYLKCDEHGFTEARKIAEKWNLHFEWFGPDQSWYSPGITSIFMFTPLIDPAT